MPDSPPPPADLDLRLVRYFTSVADHRHFGRAAADLLVARASDCNTLVAAFRTCTHDRLTGPASSGAGG